MRIAFIITGLELAGAENALRNHLHCLSDHGVNAILVSLTDKGPLGQSDIHPRVHVHSLNLSPLLANPAAILRLVRLLKAFQPDIVHTWMYHANLIGGIAARLAQAGPVIWSIHHNDVGHGLRFRTKLVCNVCAALSHLIPTTIVFCSEASRITHVRLGYNADLMCIIPHGFDPELFRPDPRARSAIREQLRIPAGAFVVGLVARFDPQKDHANFIRAAKLFSGDRTNVYFVLCGKGVSATNKYLWNSIVQTGISDRFRLLGQRNDVPAIIAALDVATCASYSEAGPLVIGEAMACAVPCVSTDVGFCSELISDTGMIVTPRNPNALVRGWNALYEMGEINRSALGSRARERIIEYYSCGDATKRYMDLYNHVMELSAMESRVVISK